jgi:surface antigen
MNFSFGQCTYWANLRYHAVTGYWVAWNGNADEWVAGAESAGWHVSTSPHRHAILVLMDDVEGASSYGHVAFVEKVISSTEVKTSNMNWYADGGGFDTESTFNFTTGSGVYFVWH